MFKIENEKEIREKYTNEIAEYFKDNYLVFIRTDGGINIQFNKDINSIIKIMIHIIPNFKADSKPNVSLYVTATAIDYTHKNINIKDNTYLQELEQILNRLKTQSDHYIKFRDELKEYLYFDANKIDYTCFYLNEIMYIKNDNNSRMIYMKPSFNFDIDLPYCDFAMVNSFNIGTTYCTLKGKRELLNDYIEFFLD